MNRPWKVLLLALIVGGTPSLAGSLLEPPELDRFLKWGPVRVRPSVEIKEFGHDDNILINSAANPVSDFVVTVAPKATGVVLFGSRAFMTFEESLDLAGYQDNSDLNYINQRGSVRLTLPRDRIGLFVDATLNRVNERPIDAEDLRPLVTEQRLGLGLIFLIGWRTEIVLGRSRGDLDYDDDDNPLLTPRLNRDIERDYIKVTYRAQGRTRLTLDADTRTYEFTRAPSSARDSEAWSVLPGVAFGEGGRLTGSLRIGWADVQPENRALPDLAELIGDAGLAYRPNRRWTWKLKGKRAPGFTASDTDVYFVETYAELGASLFFTRVFGFEVGGGRGEVTFPGSAREDDIQRYDVALLMRVSENTLGRRVQYRLGLRQGRRRSNQPSENYSTTSIGMSAVVGF